MTQEIKCSANQNLGVILRAARVELEQKNDVVISGLGAAMSACVIVSGRLEKDGLCSIAKIESNTLVLKGSRNEDREVPQLRVHLLPSNTNAAVASN